MNYCAHCKLLTPKTTCPACSKKDLGEVKKDDFCLLLECDSLFGEMLEEVLQEEGIPCAKIAEGTGVRSALGLSLEKFRMYVPYGFYEQAKDACLALSSNPEEENEDLRSLLLENRETWFIDSSSAEKKMKKKLDLPKDADLFAFCEKIVQNATDLADQGWISSCPAGGHYLAVFTEDIKLLFNSETFELLDAKKR